MSDRYFLDTSILVYSFDKTNLKKKRKADQLIRKGLSTGSGIISYQVVQEFAHVAARKFTSKLSQEEIREYFLKVLKPMCLVPCSVDLFLQGLTVASMTGFGIYDSLIISAAQKGGCKTLYSEDFQHRQKVEGVIIVNPFES